MGINRIRFMGVVVATVAGLALGTASAKAAPLTPCSSGPGLDLVNDGCKVVGQQDHKSNVEQAILDATGMVVTITLYGKSDSDGPLFEFTPEDPNGTLSGGWKVVDGTLIHYFTLKGAQEFALYHLSPPSSEGVYTSAGLLTPNQLNQPATSHISFWTVEGSSVPEPAVLTLFGLALAFAGRRLRR